MRMNVERFNDIKVGDFIEAFEEVEVKRNFNKLIESKIRESLPKNILQRVEV